MENSDFVILENDDFEIGLDIDNIETNVDNHIKPNYQKPIKSLDESFKISTKQIKKYNCLFQNCCKVSENCCAKMIIWTLLVYFNFPIVFCDLYFGYKDNTCINEPVGILNLKNYLIVYGWTVVGILSLITFCLFFTNMDSYNYNVGCLVCRTIIFSFITAIIGCFMLIWNIIGAIIFWYLMDTTGCSSNIYNYVFVSLIIKIIFCVLGIMFIIYRKENN